MHMCHGQFVRNSISIQQKLVKNPRNALLLISHVQNKLIYPKVKHTIRVQFFHSYGKIVQ